MKKLGFLAAAAALVTLSTTASADRYASAVEKAKTKGADAASSFDADPSKCSGDAAVCADYATWRPRVLAAAAVLKVAKHFETSKAHGTGFGKYVVEDGTKCLALMEGLDAESLATAMVIGDQTMTLEDGRALCQQLVDAGADQAEKKTADAAAKRAEVEAKWKKVGMKGDRLALFVDNELNSGGFDWYAKGCQTVVTDPKALAKAKKLFLWTAGANGGTLVTRYTFKGNKYKEEAKEFFTDEKAYRYCK